jgi:hypothetical protein
VAAYTRSARFREGFALARGRRDYMEDFLLVKGNLGDRSVILLNYFNILSPFFIISFSSPLSPTLFLHSGDADLYCIFDGHSGHLPAKIAANQFAEVLWEEMTEIAELEDHLLSESTQRTHAHARTHTCQLVDSSSIFRFLPSFFSLFFSPLFFSPLLLMSYSPAWYPHTVLDALSVECCSKHSSTNQYRVAIALHRTFGRICSNLKRMGAPGGTTALVALFLGTRNINSSYLSFSLPSASLSLSLSLSLSVSRWLSGFVFNFFFSGRLVCCERWRHSMYSQHDQGNCMATVIDIYLERV